MLDVADYPVVLREAAEIADHAGDPALADALREATDHLDALTTAGRDLLAEHYRICERGGWTPQGGHAASRLRELLTGKIPLVE